MGELMVRLAIRLPDMLASVAILLASGVAISIKFLVQSVIRSFSFQPLLASIFLINGIATRNMLLLTPRGSIAGLATSTIPNLTVFVTRVIPRRALFF